MDSVRILRSSQRASRRFLADEIVTIDDGITRGLAMELVAARRAEWVRGGSVPKPVEAQEPGPIETRESKSRATRKPRGPKAAKV